MHECPCYSEGCPSECSGYQVSRTTYDYLLSLSPSLLLSFPLLLLLHTLLFPLSSTQAKFILGSYTAECDAKVQQTIEICNKLLQTGASIFEVDRNTAEHVWQVSLRSSLSIISPLSLHYLPPPTSHLPPPSFLFPSLPLSPPLSLSPLTPHPSPPPPLPSPLPFSLSPPSPHSPPPLSLPSPSPLPPLSLPSPSPLPPLFLPSPSPLPPLSLPSPSPLPPSPSPLLINTLLQGAAGISCPTPAVERVDVDLPRNLFQIINVHGSGMRGGEGRR